MANQQLGSYTFAFDPDIMDIPEAKKTIVSINTYGGNALFEWEAAIDGAVIELKWKYPDTINKLYSVMNAMMQLKLVPKVCPLKEHFRGK